MSNGTVLWENPNPTAAIGTLNVPCSVSNYKYISIAYTWSQGTTFRMREIIPGDEFLNTQNIRHTIGGQGDYFVYRIITATESQITISQPSDGRSYGLLLPLEIVGYN